MVSEPYASRPAEQGDAAVPAEQHRVVPARLVITRPERLAGVLFPLGGGQVVLGRGAAADISLDDGYVSRAHALLRGTHAGYVVEDLGSSGGTSVNGKRLTGPHQLRGNDMLRLGPFFEARFEQLVDVDQTIVLPADSDLTIQFPAPADVDVTRPLRPVAPSAAPPSGAVAFVPPPPPSEAPYLAPTSVSPAPSVAATVSASAVEPPTTALSPVPPAAPLSSAAYHRQVMVERDRALHRATRAKRRAGWLMVSGLTLLLAGGATYGWILLRYYTKVDPVTGEHPHTLRVFGDPVNGVPVGKIAFGVTVGGLALLVVGIILRIVAAGRRRRARRLLVPLSAWPGSYPAPPPVYPPAAQAPPGAPLPPAYPPMTPMTPYPPRPGWPRL